MSKRPVGTPRPRHFGTSQLASLMGGSVRRWDNDLQARMTGVNGRRY
jgi:hypothetical protein